MERYWGSYRSGYYLGMKTRAPKSPIAGLMWMQQYVDLRSVAGELVKTEFFEIEVFTEFLLFLRVKW